MAILLWAVPSALADTQGTWSGTGSMSTVRAYHTATRLPNGKVLVAGGTSDGGISGLTSSELYDPQTGIWSSTGAMATSRYNHTATLLPNGKVLVAGGFNDAINQGNLDTAELYDPQAGTWSSTTSMRLARHEHRAVLLPNGKVMVMGGSLGGGDPTDQAEIYDPQTGLWDSTTSMATKRYEHTASPATARCWRWGGPGGEPRVS
jgi:N-acetylneuraminic acid mutarotase